MSLSSSAQGNMSLSQPPPEHMEATARRLETEFMTLDIPPEEDVDLMPPASFVYEPEEDSAQDLKTSAVKSIQDWGFEEVRAFLDERPMSLYLEFFDIVDGRVLSVLTDETLQELGVGKRLHRLVLINKIAKEKARSQHHVLLQSVLMRLIKALREGRGLNNSDDKHLQSSLAVNQRRVRDILTCLSVQELGSELRAKLKAGGLICELLLFVFSVTFMPKVFGADSRLLMFPDAEATGMIVRRLRRKPALSESSCANTLRALFVMLRNDDNRAAASGEGALIAIISVMDRAESMSNSAVILVLGLLILMSLAYIAANQTALVKSNGIRVIVRALAARPECIRTQEYGFRLLWLLAQDPINHDSIMEHGSIPTIISGMAAHRRRAGVQEHGCGLIRSLCFKSANKGKIIAEGGIGAVVKGMVEHGDHPGVQEHGSAALRLMSAGAEISKTLKGHTLKSSSSSSSSSAPAPASQSAAPP